MKYDSVISKRKDLTAEDAEDPAENAEFETLCDLSAENEL